MSRLSLFRICVWLACTFGLVSLAQQVVITESYENFLSSSDDRQWWCGESQGPCEQQTGFDDREPTGCCGTQCCYGSNGCCDYTNACIQCEYLPLLNPQHGYNRPLTKSGTVGVVLGVGLAALCGGCIVVGLRSYICRWGGYYDAAVDPGEDVDQLRIPDTPLDSAGPKHHHPTPPWDTQGPRHQEPEDLLNERELQQQMSPSHGSGQHQARPNRHDNADEGTHRNHHHGGTHHGTKRTDHHEDHESHRHRQHNSHSHHNAHSNHSSHNSQHRGHHSSEDDKDDDEFDAALAQAGVGVPVEPVMANAHYHPSASSYDSNKSTASVGHGGHVPRAVAVAMPLEDVP
jgi:hypothetical protein